MFVSAQKSGVILFAGASKVAISSLALDLWARLEAGGGVSL